MDSAIERWFDPDETSSPKDIFNLQDNFCFKSNYSLNGRLGIDQNIDLINEAYGLRLTGENINNTMKNQIDACELASIESYGYEFDDPIYTFTKQQLKSVEDFIQSYKTNKDEKPSSRSLKAINNEASLDALQNLHLDPSPKVQNSNEDCESTDKILCQEQEAILRLSNEQTKNSEFETKIVNDDKLHVPLLRVKQLRSKKNLPQQDNSLKKKLIKNKTKSKKRVKNCKRKNKKSKSKKDKKDSKLIKNLSQRKDVVNKTLLRSLKRYFTNLLKDNYEDYLRSKNTEINNIILDNGKRLTVSSVKTFIEIMISPITSKKKLKNKTEKSMYMNFYSCLYQYSHTKLYALLKSPQLKFLLLDYFRDGMDVMINTDETLKKNPDVYKEASRRFISLINN